MATKHVGCVLLNFVCLGGWLVGCLHIMNDIAHATVTLPPNSAY